MGNLETWKVVGLETFKLMITSKDAKTSQVEIVMLLVQVVILLNSFFELGCSHVAG